MLLRLNAALYGGWLFLILLVFYISSGHNENLLQYAVMIGVVPAGLQLLLLGFDSRGLYRPLLLSVLIVLVVAISYLANPGYVADWTPVIFTVNVIFLMSVGIIIAGCPDRRLALAAAAAYAVIGSIFLVHINLDGTYVWGRLRAAGLQPNYWGLVGLSVAVGAFGFRRMLLAGPCIAIGCWTMYDASSRSSMLGLAVAVLVILARSARDLRGMRLCLAIAGATACLVAAVVFWSSVDTATLTFGNDVFKLNDPYRGLDTGFTGREGLWTGTFDLWLKHPLFGVGFREHEQILDFPSHNGYLAMLADTGIFGFLLYCTMLCTSLLAAWRMPDPSYRRFVLAVVVAYAIMSLFERRAINTGNPFGFLIVIACFLALGLDATQGMRARQLQGSQSLQPRSEAG
jgi:O-antigen ligase